MEDDGGGKGGDYVLMADNVVTPVHNDNVEKVRKRTTSLLFPALVRNLVMVRE